MVASLHAATKVTKTYSNFAGKFDFSNLGPVPVGTVSGESWIFATQFTAGVAGSLDAVEFGAFPNVGNAATVTLYTDNDSLPGIELESFSATIEAATGKWPGVVAKGLSQTKTPLTAGTKYWIALSVPNTTKDSFSWAYPLHQAPGLTVFQTGNGPWQSYPTNLTLTLIVTVKTD
jgi:hypothetical protein